MIWYLKSLVTKTSGTYISQYFPQGLLYATLVEAYGFLKGPMDMLTLYENKYKQEVAKVCEAYKLVEDEEMTIQMVLLEYPIKSPTP